MVTKLNKNVLLVQDIPSNLIKEAILILKTENKKINNKTKEILMLEANELINDCSNKLQNEYIMKLREQRDAENKKRRQKINLLTIIVFLFFTSIIVLIASLF